MARKKRQTYSDMVRTLADIQERAITEKDRMAGVLASELDHDTALRLGDLSESELRHVARFVFDHIGMFVNLAKLDMPQRLQAAEDGPMAEGELRYDHAKNCWDIRDTDTDERIETLRNGMCVELLDDGDWKTVEVRMSVMDIWGMWEKSKKDLPTSNGICGMFDGLRVRVHKAKV